MKRELKTCFTLLTDPGLTLNIYYPIPTSYTVSQLPSSVDFHWSRPYVLFSRFLDPAPGGDKHLFIRGRGVGRCEFKSLREEAKICIYIVVAPVNTHLCNVIESSLRLYMNLKAKSMPVLAWKL